MRPGELTAAADCGLDEPLRISGSAMIIGSIIIAIMATAFAIIGGRPLIVTFLPGLALVWLIYLWLYKSKRNLPGGRALYPIFFGTLSWQFLHFFEEFATGFRVRFPELYSASPYSAELFVGINMVSYFVFAISFIVATEKRIAPLYIPALFFVIYGGMGNAIAHPLWAVYTGGYFPGLFTSIPYWFLAPAVLSYFVGGFARAFTIAIFFSVILVPILIITAS